MLINMDRNTKDQIVMDAHVVMWACRDRRAHLDSGRYVVADVYESIAAEYAANAFALAVESQA